MNTASTGLPGSWSLELDSSARRSPDRRVLIGGAPRRLVELSPAGATWLDAVVRGGAVGDGIAEQQLARRLVDAGLAHPRPPHGTGPTRRDVALVVPVRDMAEGLARTLAAVGEVGEVIVVDDGSRDPSAVRDAARHVRVIRNERPLGPAAARQTGWRATTLPYVVFVDAEITAPGGIRWVDRLLPQFGDDALAAIAPRIRAAPGDAPWWLAAYEHVRSPLDRGPKEAPVAPGGAVPYVPTTALVARRQALEAIGGFDTDLRVGEDVDLVWRFQQSGWRVRYDASVELTHPSRPTVAGWMHQRVTYGASAAALARRHGDAVAPLRISGWTGPTSLALLLGLPRLAAAIGAGAVVARARGLRALHHPTRQAARLVVEADVWGARQLAEALRRPWWPFAVALGLASRRSRPALLVAVVIPPVLDLLEHRSALGMVPFGALRLADDVAYGSGVWLGCARERSLRALLPAFVGRRRTSPAPATTDRAVIRGTCRTA